MCNAAGPNRARARLHAAAVIAIAAALGACTSTPDWLPTSGPTRAQISDQGSASPKIPVVDITESVAHKVSETQRRDYFLERFGDKAPGDYVAGPGDALDVSVWEAPPAVLFGSVAPGLTNTSVSTAPSTLPEQVVALDGTISVPFIGAVQVAGKTIQGIAADIVARLADKAHQPQVLVRVSHNATMNVTIVGDVPQSLRMPLTAKGERLLDALAAAGGGRSPVNRTSLQLSRGGDVLTMPLDSVIRDPKQNIALRPGDVLTVLFQSNSFIALGATGKNDEVLFETQGISLSQALGRVNGLVDTRADSLGVFVFRFEEPEAFPDGAKGLPRTREGKVPVVYRADLKNPATFLLAQDFPVRDKDVIYVANAPAADLQKFLTILTEGIYSVNTIINGF